MRILSICIYPSGGSRLCYLTDRYKLGLITGDVEGSQGMRVVCVDISSRWLLSVQHLSSRPYRNVFSTVLEAILFGGRLFLLLAVYSNRYCPPTPGCHPLFAQLHHPTSLKLPVLGCTDVEMNCIFAANT